MSNIIFSIENIQRETATRRHVFENVLPAVFDVVKQFDGKQASKRFIDALEKIPGVYTRCYQYSFYRIEVYYHGPAYYSECNDPRPAFNRELSVLAVDTDGRGKSSHVNAGSVIIWASGYLEDAKTLEDVTGGTLPEWFTAYNAAVDAFNKALENVPSVVYHAAFGYVKRPPALEFSGYDRRFYDGIPAPALPAAKAEKEKRDTESYLEYKRQKAEKLERDRVASMFNVSPEWAKDHLVLESL